MHILAQKKALKQWSIQCLIVWYQLFFGAHWCTPVELGYAVRHIRTPISFVLLAFLLFRVSLSGVFQCGWCTKLLCSKIFGACAEQHRDQIHPGDQRSKLILHTFIFGEKKVVSWNQCWQEEGRSCTLFILLFVNNLWLGLIGMLG